MSRIKLLNQAMFYFLLVVYFILTTIFFYLAMEQGNDGVSYQFSNNDDGIFYWKQAHKVVAGDESAIITSIYVLIIGNLIKITGIENAFLIRFLNFLGVILLSVLSLKLIKLFSNTNPLDSQNKENIFYSGIFIYIIYMCYASLLINTTISIFRDIWIFSLYLLAIVLSCKVLFQKNANSRILLIIFIIPVLWLLGEFRGYALVSFLLSTLIYFIYKRLKAKNKGLILLCIIIFGIGFIYYTFFMNLKVPYINMSLNDALSYRHSALELSAGSQMWIRLNQPNFVYFIINYVHSYLGNLIGPLPWHIRGLSSMVIFIAESIPMTIILIYLWRNRNTLTEVQRYVILHALVWIGLIAITNDNIGTATRLRAVGWILILIVFAYNYLMNRRKKNNSNILINKSMVEGRLIDA